MPSPNQDQNNQVSAALGSDDPIGPIDEGGGMARGDQSPLGGFGAGQILDNTYRIVRVIGEGGMGVVYEAAHARLSGRYAIKALIHNLSDDPDAMARFDREARITSSLQHPNIVQVVDFNRHTDGTEYLVMEYLQGETLAERLRRVGALRVDRVVGMVEQVAAGLAAAHSHGVVHRDLKPENIFLIPVEGRHVELVKVLDFGISKISDAKRGFQRPESALMGTPEYMSPEQCRGRPGTVDAASDQFALAAITYQMLTGRSPFVGDSVGEVMSRVLHADPQAMGIDPAVERVVMRGMAKAKLQRFPSVTAFADALRGAASGDIDTANRFDDQKVELRRPRRNRGAVLLVVAAVSVAVYFVVGSNGVRSMLMPRPSTPVASFQSGPRPTEVQPVEVQPIEVQPIEVQPIEVQPIGVQPVEVRPVEVRPVEVRPMPVATEPRRPVKANAPKRASARTRATRTPVPSPARVSVPLWTVPQPVETARPIWRRPITPDLDATLPLDETRGDAP